MNREQDIAHHGLTRMAIREANVIREAIRQARERVRAEAIEHAIAHGMTADDAADDVRELVSIIDFGVKSLISGRG